MVAYAAKFDPEEDGGAINVTFRDIPEAVTYGADEREAVEMAEDVLASALSYYAERGEPFPQASAPKRGERLIFLPALIEAKLGLWVRMGEMGLSKADLATKLGVDHKIVRRLLKFDHNSRIEAIEAALAVLGKRLSVRIE